MNTKLIEQRRRGKDHANITKVAAEFFRAANATKTNNNSNVNVSDTVKTMTVSNGNKALTNNMPDVPTINSENSDIVPSNSCNVIVDHVASNVAQSSEQAQSISNVSNFVVEQRFPSASVAIRLLTILIIDKMGSSF